MIKTSMVPLLVALTRYLDVAHLAFHAEEYPPNDGYQRTVKIITVAPLSEAQREVIQKLADERVPVPFKVTFEFVPD